jgi:hypothetical protein
MRNISGTSIGDAHIITQSAITKISPILGFSSQPNSVLSLWDEICWHDETMSSRQSHGANSISFRLCFFGPLVAS